MERRNALICNAARIMGLALHKGHIRLSWEIGAKHVRRVCLPVARWWGCHKHISATVAQDATTRCMCEPLMRRMRAVRER